MNFMDAGQFSDASLQVQQFLFVYLCVSLLELRSYSENHSIWLKPKNVKAGSLGGAYKFSRGGGAEPPPPAPPRGYGHV